MALDVAALASAGLLLLGAPSIGVRDLRARADLEMRAIVAALPAAEEERVAGIYLAFAPDETDPTALAACDDDGDYVVVISDAMLRLVEYVSAPEPGDSRSKDVTRYARFFANAQTTRDRLVPPPPGFFSDEGETPASRERADGAMSFLLARELTHARLGELTCPHPTRTRERGDDEWTRAEATRADIRLRTMNPGTAERDGQIAEHLALAGKKTEGALAILTFFAGVEAVAAQSPYAFIPSYLARHPHMAARRAAFERAIENAKKT